MEDGNSSFSRGGGGRGRGRGFRGGYNDNSGGRGRGGRGGWVDRGGRGRGGWVDRGGSRGRGRGGWVDRGGSRGRGDGGWVKRGRGGFNDRGRSPNGGHFRGRGDFGRGRGRGGGDSRNNSFNRSDGENDSVKKHKNTSNKSAEDGEDDDEEMMEDSDSSNEVAIKPKKPTLKKSSGSDDEGSDDDDDSADEENEEPIQMKVPDDDDEEDDDDEDDDDDDDDDDEVNTSKGKNKLLNSSKPQVKSIGKTSSDDLDSESEESFIPINAKQTLKNQKSNAAIKKTMPKMEEGSSDGSDSDDESESDENQLAQKPQSNKNILKLKPFIGQKSVEKDGDDSDSDEDNSFSQVASNKKHGNATPGKPNSTPAKSKAVNQNKTPQKTAQNNKQKQPMVKREIEEDSEEEKVDHKKIKIEHSDILALEADRKREVDCRSLFIGNLPEGIDEATLKSLVPKATAIRLFVRKNKVDRKDPNASKWKRFVFLEFESEDIAEEELIRLRNHKLGDKQMTVDYVGAKSSRLMEQRKPSETKPLNMKKLFIRGIPPTTTIQDISILFPKADKISFKPPGEVKKTCNVFFANTLDAAEAFKNSNFAKVQDQRVFVLYGLKNKKKKATKLKNQIAKAKEQRGQNEDEEEDSSSSSDED